MVVFTFRAGLPATSNPSETLPHVGKGSVAFSLVSLTIKIDYHRPVHYFENGSDCLTHPVWNLIFSCLSLFNAGIMGVFCALTARALRTLAGTLLTELHLQPRWNFLKSNGMKD